MDFGCVFYYSWVPPQLNLLAFAFLTMLAVRYRTWPALYLVALLAPWLWFSEAQPGPTYYTVFALFVLSFRFHWHKQRNTLRPRACSYILAGYLGYVALPGAAGVPIQLTHCCTYCSCNLRNLASAVEQYQKDHKRLPATLEQAMPNPPGCISTPTNAAARIFYARLQIGDGYTYQRLPEGNYLIRCSNRNLPGHSPEAPTDDSRQP